MKPDRVDLRKISRTGTFWRALFDLGVLQDGFEQHVIMNGMELVNTATLNTRLKVVVDYEKRQEGGIRLQRLPQTRCLSYNGVDLGSMDIWGTLMASADPDHPVEVFGCRDIAMVQKPDANLVCHRKMVAKVKELQMLVAERFGPRYE